MLEGDGADVALRINVDDGVCIEVLLDLTPFTLARFFIVWQIIGINANEIGLWIGDKTYGANVSFAANERLQHAVHSIHDAAVVRKDEGMAGISFIDEACVFRDIAARHRLSPIWLVELSDASDWHELRLKVSGQGDEAINIPSPQSGGTGPEVILLAHALLSRKV